MAWGNVRETRNKLYEADYNRAYDTHVETPTSREFEVNGPNRPDAAPENTPASRAYKNPLTAVVDLDPMITIGPREIQTGNAPSGGYSTDPGNGFASNLNSYEFPDSRRMLRYRPYDFETDQVAVDTNRDLELRKRRAETTAEDLDSMDSEKRFSAVHAVEHSPYEQKWGEGDRMTSGINPNRFRFWRDWGTSNGVSRDAGSRYLNGEHYSMATHNTLNPYGDQLDGMQPVTRARNTFRLDPQPWDAGYNDAPTNTANYATRIGRESVGDEAGLGRSYRL